MTATQFGGQRWWFTCPITINGVACNHRVGKLYLPPYAKYFGCRHCHRLSYRSCQEAHQDERMFYLITGSREFDPEFYKRLIEQLRGG